MLLRSKTLLLWVLRFIWTVAILWGEIGAFFFSVSECRWPDRILRRPGEEVKPTHVLLVADPQVLDDKAHGTFKQFVMESHLRKSWDVAKRLKPHAVVFLGDMMNAGRHATISDEAYHTYYRRFKDIFSLESSIPTFYVVGNRDVGLGSSRQFSDRARDRFRVNFGEVNQVVEIRNHSFVLLDSPGLVEEDYKRFAAEMEFDEWLPVSGGSIAFVKKVAAERPSNPIILFTHIPLARPDGASCGPLRERGSIRRGAGNGYQNLMGKQTSSFVLEGIIPSVIFSGDNHDYCEYTHVYSQGTVREVTVKAFSMGMGIKYPGFQLLSLVPPQPTSLYPSISPTHADRPCLLPNQATIYMKVYLPLAFLTLLLLLYINIYPSVLRNARKSPELRHKLSHSSMDGPSRSTSPLLPTLSSRSSRTATLMVPKLRSSRPVLRPSSPIHSPTMSPVLFSTHDSDEDQHYPPPSPREMSASSPTWSDLGSPWGSQMNEKATADSSNFLPSQSFRRISTPNSNQLRRMSSRGGAPWSPLDGYGQEEEDEEEEKEKERRGLLGLRRDDWGRTGLARRIPSLRRWVVVPLALLWQNVPFRANRGGLLKFVVEDCIRAIWMPALVFGLTNARLWWL